MHSLHIKKYSKLALRVLAFMLVLLLAIFVLSVILMPKTNAESGGMHNYRAKGFYGEAENSLDVVAIGNSDLYSGFSPMELWDQYGMTAYACGQAKQRVNQAFYLLKEILTCQQPKVVILEVDSIFQEAGNGHVISLVKSAIKYAFPVIEYHNRWKQITPEELLGEAKPWHDYAKGYMYSEETVPYTGGDYMQKKRKGTDLDQVTKHYLDAFLELCSEKDIQVMMVEMPSASSWSMARHEAVAAYAEENSIPFIDFNLNMDETGFDWQTDTRDSGNHLNNNGAVKITSWLGDYLTQHYTFEDHREDDAYAVWHWDLSLYRHDQMVSSRSNH